MLAKSLRASSASQLDVPPVAVRGNRRVSARAVPSRLQVANLSRAQLPGATFGTGPHKYGALNLKSNGRAACTTRAGGRLVCGAAAEEEFIKSKAAMEAEELAAYAVEKAEELNTLAVQLAQVAEQTADELAKLSEISTQDAEVAQAALTAVQEQDGVASSEVMALSEKAFQSANASERALLAAQEAQLDADNAMLEAVKAAEAAEAAVGRAIEMETAERYAA